MKNTSTFNVFFILFFLIQITTHTTHAQTKQQQIDSLTHCLSSIKKPDSKGHIYYKLAKLSIGIDYDQATSYAQLALKFYPNNNDSTLGNVYGLLGIIKAQTYDNELAHSYFDTSIHHYQKAEDNEGLGLAYGYKGALYIHLDQYPQGAQYLYKSLAIHKKMGNTNRMVATLTNILSVHKHLSEIDEGIKVGQKILSLIDTNYYDGFLVLSRALYTMGGLYFSNYQIDSALYYFQQSIPILKKIEDQELLAMAYIQCADSYAMLEQYDSAKITLNKATSLKEAIFSKRNQLEFLILSSHIYYRTKDYPQSIQIAKTALDSSIAVKNINFQEQSFNMLKLNYLQLKDFEKAYHYQNLSYTLLDSIIGLEKQKTIQELEVKYETAKKEHENQLLVQEKNMETFRADRNRLLLYLAVLATLFILLFGGLLLRQYKINANHLTNQLKHRLLRNQMSPHFIFNALVAIQNFVYQKEPILAGEYLASFATLIRAILDNSRQEYISLEKEMQWLDNYLKLQLLRFDNSFDYNIHMAENIDLENMLIPPMLTQPFIENALEHGLKDLHYRGQLQVNFTIKDQILHIEVQDNGIGLEASKLKNNSPKHQSLATAITKERLDFLNKKRRNKIYFDIETLESKGTLVSFSIPLTYKY